jgi:hypothetical protein
MASAQQAHATRPQDPPPTRPENVLNEPVYIRPIDGIHLTKAGKVALGNWVGKVGGTEYRIYAGAPIGNVPAPVRAAMEKSRVGFGIMTMKDLGPTPDDRTLPAREPELPPEE